MRPHSLPLLLATVLALPARAQTISDCRPAVRGNDTLLTTNGISASAETAIGDIDGDGKLDIATVGDGFAVRVALNRGPAFEVIVGASNVSQAHMAGIADVDGDGHPDVVLQNLDVFRGPATATPTFVRSQLVARPEQSLSAPTTAVGDFDGDGRADAAYYLGGSIQVCLGQSDATFKPGVVLPAGSQSSDVLAADLDHDGKIDLIRVFTPIAIYWNDGNLHFTEANFNPNVAVRTLSIYVRPDGAQQLVVTDPGGLDVYEADSGRTFHAVAHVSMPQELALTSGRLADLDGDGIVDAIGCALSRFAVRWGNADGSFSDPEIHGLPNGTNLEIGDLNGDGAADILPKRYAPHDLPVIWSTLGQRRLEASSIPHYDDAALATGDFNGDGFPDSIRAVDYTNFAVWFGDGKGGYTQGATFATTTTTQDVHGLVADFDGDHNLDVSFAGGASRAASIFFGDGHGHFTAMPLQGSNLYLAGTIKRQNGTVSLVEGTTFSNALTELRITASRDIVPVTIAPNARVVSILDVDGDGISELFLNDPTTSPGTAVLLKQTGDNWTEVTRLSSLDGPLAVGDFDGDGRMDLFDGGRMVIYPATASGFGNQIFVDSWSIGIMRGVAAVDVDGDGLLDLIISRDPQNPYIREANVEILNNIGKGKFIRGQVTDAIEAGTPLSLDLDGDGRIDAVRIGTEIIPIRCLPLPMRVAVTPSSPQPGDHVRLIVNATVNPADVALLENGKQLATASFSDFAFTGESVFTLQPTPGTHVYELRYSSISGNVSQFVTVSVGTPVHRRAVGP